MNIDKKMLLKPISTKTMSLMNNKTINPSQIAQLIVEGSLSNHTNECFHNFSPIYSITNEPIYKYLNNLNLENKEILTVASSGDFLLSAVFNNSKNITTFDINLFSKYYQELKVSAIKHLTYNDFINFFSGDSVFDNDIYDILKKSLPYKVREFWDALFNYYDGKQIYNSQLFFDQIKPTYNLINYTSYANCKKSYEEVQKKIKNINFTFYNLDILKVPYVLNKQYDLIMLSNIPTYITKMGNSINQIVNYLQNNMLIMLKEKGLILTTFFCYKPIYIKEKSFSIEQVENNIHVLTLTNK